MKALAVFPESKEVKIIEHEEPEITAPWEVKLRMLEVGVCGTDLEICAFQYGDAPAGSDYLILGHESLGEVVEVGAAVRRVKAGDLVVPMVRRPCGHAHCVPCRSGRQDFCVTGDFQERGINRAHGFLSAFAKDHEMYMVPVPGALKDVAVLIEPLTIAKKALMQAELVQGRLPRECLECTEEGGRSQKAVVLGAGSVGILGAMCLVSAGFETFVYSRAPAPNPKASLVESIGATYVSSQESNVDELAKSMGNIDLVYEAAGASKISFDVLRVLGTNGVFVFTGVPGRKAPVEVDTDLIMRNLVLKNQIVFGTVNADRSAFEAAVRDLDQFSKTWPDAVRSLITARRPVEDFYPLLIGKSGGIKNVIVLD